MQTSYRDTLTSTFHERSQANPRYSLRAFARDLGIAPSTLSGIMNGKAGISVEMSAQLAKNLRLPKWQWQVFRDLALKEHGKSPRLRKEAERRLAENEHENQIRLISNSALKALASWIDLAILELTYFQDFEPSSEWIAKKLRVEEYIVRASVQRLKTVGLLKIEGLKWTDASPLFTSSDGIPSEAIRQFHKTVLHLALKRLESKDVEARTVKSVVFSLSKANIPRAKKVIDEAIAKIVALAEKPEQTREDVMCFSSQLFSLLGPNGGTK